MKINRFIIVTLLCLGLLMVISPPGGADDTALPKRELLLFQEIPVVITPAKMAQPMLESPSTITVLTREDIRRYGITSFSDILRNVPGVDVLSISPTDRNISVRGFNQLVAGRILSLVNGRAIYTDFHGMTLWELLPISIDEIERIEIVRGPGSALYGANAFDGVVNIITDSWSADPGTRANVMVNQAGRLSESITHGGKANDLTYKASMGWNRISGWSDEDADTGENKTFNGYIQYAMYDRSSLRLSGGVQDTHSSLQEPSGFDPIKLNLAMSYLKLDYARPNLACHIFWDRVDNAGTPGEDGTESLEDNTFDADLQHTFRLWNNNTITWGGNYRFNWMESRMIDAPHTQNLWAGYIQDQFRPSEKLILTTGLRYDKHPLTGSNFSPRGSITYSPITGHALRASVGRAFQNPTSLFSYFSIDSEVSMPMSPASVKINVRGNRELSPEWMTSFELGYQGTFRGRLRCGVDLFFNRLHGLIDFKVVETYPENAIFPGSPGGVIPAVMSPLNSRDAEARGGEVAAELLVTHWLAVYANYSYQHVTDSDTGERIESAPQHKLNSGLYSKPGWSFLFNLFANYVDETVWDDAQIDPYIMLNFVVSHRPLGGNLDITLSVSNLLNNKHIEHPEGAEVGRSMILRLMYEI